MATIKNDFFQKSLPPNNHGWKLFHKMCPFTAMFNLPHFTLVQALFNRAYNFREMKTNQILNVELVI